MKKLTIMFIILLLFVIPCFAQKYGNTKPSPGVQINWSHPLAQGQLLHFLMNEGSGGTIFDATLNYEASYTLTGFNWNTFGLHGYAIDKNGSAADGFITNRIVSHGIGTGDFTIVAWVKPEGLTTYRGICANGSFSPALYTRLSTTTNWGIYWGSDRGSGNDLVVDTWHHLVVTRRAGIIYFYQDGIQTPTTHSISTSMADAVFNIGFSGSGSEVLDGLVESIIFYNRGLTENEIWSLYINPYAMFEQPLYGRILAVAAAAAPSVTRRRFIITNDE